MLLDINDLWDSRDEREWEIALNRYWPNPSWPQRLRTSTVHSTVDLEYVRGLGVQEWYAFLIKYFHWQFAGNHLQEELRDLDRHGFEQLFSEKCSFIAIDQSELSDERKCLNLVRSPRIRGLDYPGASCLLGCFSRMVRHR